MSRKHVFSDTFFTVVTLCTVFLLNLFLVWQYNTKTMTPMIFVLGVFLVSWRTQGYFFGIAASLISVLAVNWAFTYPYWEFDLISPECISSALVMLIVSTMTGALTTRLKQQEKLKAEAETERMRGNLLRAVSHDLRTPLTSIYGSCSAIIENFDSIPRDKQLSLLTDMQTDAQWLNRMVENLLSVTRVDADKVRLSKHSVVLEELIDALLVKFHKHYPDKTIQVTIPEDFVSIPMDPVLIEQVLMNLLENAVFHAHGMKNLWLRVELQNKHAVFFVEDDAWSAVAVIAAWTSVSAWLALWLNISLWLLEESLARESHLACLLVDLEELHVYLVTYMKNVLYLLGLLPVDL